VFDRPVGYFGQFALQGHLEKLLHCKVDLGTPNSLKPRIREQVLKEIFNAAKDWKERIQDILDAIYEIQKFTNGMDYDSFSKDERTIRAVVLDFIVTDEASSQIPENVQVGYPEIPWQLLRAIRNRIVHAYFSVDAKLLWDTAENDLPLLIEPLKRIK